jgi:hypothetical protein
LLDGTRRFVFFLLKEEQAAEQSLYFSAHFAVIRGDSYDFKCDIYSLGILFFEVLCETSDVYGQNGRFSGSIEVRIATQPNFRPVLPPGLELEGK